MIPLFELKDIEPQLNEKQIEELKHIMWYAKQKKDIEGARIGEFGKKIAVFPSGKMCFIPEEPEKCPSCNAYILKDGCLCNHLCANNKAG